MSEQSDFNLPEEIEAAVKAVFSHPKPNPTFVDRLGHQLSDQVEQLTTHQRKVQMPVSPMAWGAIGIIFILLLVWGIKILLPRGEQRISSPSTPSPIVSPTPVMKPTQAAGVERSPIVSPPQAIGPTQTEGVEGTINLPSRVRIPIPRPEEAITVSNAYAIGQLSQFGKGVIWGIAWSPDDKTFAVSSSTGIYLYETANFTEIKMITNNGGVNGIVYSPDGTKLAVHDGLNLKIWEIASGKVLLTLSAASDWSFSSLAFSPVGSLIAFNSGNNMIKLLDSTSGKKVATLIGFYESEFVSQLAFSPDGSKLVSLVSNPTTIRVWDIASRTVRLSLYDCKGDEMALSPDGLTLAVGQENAIVLCDIKNGSVISKFNTNAGNSLHLAVKTMTFSPDGTILASVVDNAIKLWEIPSMEEVLTMEDVGVRSIAFSPDGRRLASASTDSVEIWDTASGHVLDTITGPVAIYNGQSSAQLAGYGSVNYLAFSPDGKFLATLADEGILKIYNMPSGILFTELGAYEEFNPRFAFSPDGKLIAVWGGHYLVSEGGYLVSGVVTGVQIWDVAKQELRLKLDRFSDIVQSVAFSPDGVTLATGEGNGYGYPGAVKLWNIATGELLQELDTKPGELLQELETKPMMEAAYDFTAFDVAFSPDGSLLAVASGTGSVLIWNVSKQMHEAVFTSPANKLYRVAFSPDGNLLAAATITGELYELRLWDLATGKTLLILERKNYLTHVVAFSPDGSILASVSEEGSVRLWDVHTGEALATLDGDFSAVAFSPDGTLLATVASDDTVRLWGIPQVPPNIK